MLYNITLRPIGAEQGLKLLVTASVGLKQDLLDQKKMYLFKIRSGKSIINDNN